MPGVSVATASRVATRLRARQGRHARAGRALDARAALRPSWRDTRDGRDRIARPRTSPTRSSPRSRRRWRHARRDSGLRLDPLHHREPAFREAEYVHMLLERRVDGMIFISSEAADLSGEHGHYARLLGRRADRLRQRRPGPLDVPSWASTNARPASSRRSTCSTSATRGSASSRGRSTTCPTREKAAGWRTLAPRGGRCPARRPRRPRRVRRRGRPGRAAHAARKRNRPTGIICSSDLMAIGVLKARRARDFACPRTSRSSASTASRPWPGPTRR